MSSYVIIGGGPRSLGGSVASKLRDFGYDVIVLDRNPDPDESQDIWADATDIWFGDKLLGVIKDREPNAVVNFVGAIDFQRCQELTMDRFSRIVVTNLWPLAGCAYAIANYPGSTSFIQIGSNAGSYPFTGMFSYSTSKAAQKQAIKILAKEIAPRSRANIINPGPFPPGASQMSDSQIPLIFGDVAEGVAIDSMKNRIPMGELCSVGELLNLIHYITFNTSYITGQVFELSGGQIL